jgi:hypothetical protein
MYFPLEHTGIPTYPYTTKHERTHTRNIRIQISRNKTKNICDNLNENENVGITYQGMDENNERKAKAVTD